jgi:hypothetical protein
MEERLRHAKEDMEEVGRILDAWDPIGVYREPADAPPAGEYERLVGPVLTKLRAGAGIAEVATYLEWESRTNMGLTGPLGEREAAQRLVNWWQQRIDR